MNFAGIDIGGANIKLAVLNGPAKQVAFPIWNDKHRLTDVLSDIATLLPPDTAVGITMTAELADCFATKREGVEFIVRAVIESLANHAPLFYRTEGTMCDANTAIQHWRSVAASNWHALAAMAFAEMDDDSGFVLDIGSTTTDIIPVRFGSPVADKQGDFERLSNGQLCYAGVGRTPVCSILRTVQMPAGQVAMAREFFATMADVFLYLGQIEPDESSTETADGRPATRRHAGQRLSRMVCADFEDLGNAGIELIAQQAKTALTTLLAESLQQVVSSHADIPLIVRTFGKGAWLAGDVMDEAFDELQRRKAKLIAFSKDEVVNQTAPALAVARFRKRVNGHSGGKDG